MKGIVRAKFRCECGGKFTPETTSNRILDLKCELCGKSAKRFIIDLRWNNKRVVICSDSRHVPLDSYARAELEWVNICKEIEDHTFDPAKYVRSQAAQFYTCNLLDSFLKRKKSEIAPSYKSDYERMTERAKNFFRRMDVRNIRKADIIAYKDSLTVKGKTLKNHIDHFKTFLRHCKEDLEIIKAVPNFPTVDYQQRAIKWIGHDLQSQAYSLVRKELKPIYAFLMLHGCRPSEARALRCKDVDLENKTVTISATFSGTEYREKRKGKRSSPATIPIHSEIFPYIVDRVRNNLPEAYVFVNPRTGRNFNKNTLLKEWSRIREKMKFDSSLRLYDATRHSFASQLINQNVSIYTVSRFLGHSSIKMTEKYAHGSVEAMRGEQGKVSLEVLPECNQKRNS